MDRFRLLTATWFDLSFFSRRRRLVYFGVRRARAILRRACSWTAACALKTRGFGVEGPRRRFFLDSFLFGLEVVPLVTLFKYHLTLSPSMPYRFARDFMSSLGGVPFAKPFFKFLRIHTRCLFESFCLAIVFYPFSRNWERPSHLSAR